MKLFCKNFINGVYSGIPLCCVLYFCMATYKNPYRLVGLLSDRKRKNLLPNKEEQKTVISDFVLCNKCFKKGKNKYCKDNGLIFK